MKKYTWLRYKPWGLHLLAYSQRMRLGPYRDLLLNHSQAYFDFSAIPKPVTSTFSACFLLPNLILRQANCFEGGFRQ